MKRFSLSLPLFGCFCLVQSVTAAQINEIEGMINLPSPFSVEVTVEKFEKTLDLKKISIFKKINHSHSISDESTEVSAAFLILFGDPKVGTPLMRCNKSVGIDLPQKAMVWEDKSKQVWLSYNDPLYLLKRHDLKGCEELVIKLQKVIHAIATETIAL